MTMTRLAEASDQDVVARLEEDDPGPDAPALERAAHRGQGERRVTGADVEDDRDAGEPRRDPRTPARRGPGSSSPGRLSTTV